MSSLLMVLLSSVLVTTVVLAHMPQWRPFVAPTDIFGGARARCDRLSRGRAGSGR